MTEQTHPDYPIRHGVPVMAHCTCGGVRHWHAAAPYGCDDCDCAGFVLDEDWCAPEREPAQDETYSPQDLQRVYSLVREIQWRHVESDDPSDVTDECRECFGGIPCWTRHKADEIVAILDFENLSVPSGEPLSGECPTNHIAPDGKPWADCSDPRTQLQLKFCPDCGAPLDDPKGETQ